MMFLLEFDRDYATAVAPPSFLFGFWFGWFGQVIDL